MYVLAEHLGGDLFSHVESYCHLLRSKTRFYTEQSYHYLCGLFQSEKRNIEKMSEEVAESDLQRMHHFISESPWEWQPLFSQISQEAYIDLSTPQGPLGLIIDESGWAKQGRHSVGVARQYLGRLANNPQSAPQTKHPLRIDRPSASARIKLYAQFRIFGENNLEALKRVRNISQTTF